MAQRMRTFGTAAVIIAALFFSCCSRTRHVTEQMPWSARPMLYPLRPLPSGAVRFTFSYADNYHIVVTDVPWLLERLRASGANSAKVEFDVHCSLTGRVQVFNVTAVNGFPVPAQASGWMESTPNRQDLGPFWRWCD